MLKGARVIIEKLTKDLITTPRGDQYRLGPLPNDHINLNHSGPNVGDALIAVTHSSSEIGTPTLVTIDGGCGCKLGIYLKSLAEHRSSN